MRLRNLIGISLVATLAAFGSACGDDTDGTGGAGATSSSSTGSPTTSSSTTGGGGDGAGGGPASACPLDSAARDGYSGTYLTVGDKLSMTPDDKADDPVKAYDGFALVAGLITDKSAADARISPYFTDLLTGPPANVDAFKKTLADYLVLVYGGTQAAEDHPYEGNVDMVAVHTGMNISSEDYDYFVSDIIVPSLTEALVALGVTDEAVQSAVIGGCFAPAVTDAEFKASIVGH